jgi:hypothetical protein
MTLERLSHYAILVIALLAVVVSVWQGQILQAHNKLSVKPFMDYLTATRADSTNTIIQSVTLSNRGIGPAIIQDVTYSFKNVDFNTLTEVLDSVGIRSEVRTMYEYGENTVLSPDNELLVLRIEKKDYKRIGISVSIQYQSIYEEDFELSFGF